MTPGGGLLVISGVLGVKGSWVMGGADKRQVDMGCIDGFRGGIAGAQTHLIDLEGRL